MNRFLLSHPLAAATGLASCAMLVAWAMDRHVSITSQAMVTLLAVVFAAFRLGRSHAILTAILSVSALNFFFVPPRLSFAVAEPDYAIALGALLLVSLVVSSQASRLHEKTAQALGHERRARRLHALGEALAGATSEPELFDQVSDAIHEAFGQPCCTLVPDTDGVLASVAHRPAGSAPATVDPDAARWAFEHAASMGPTTGRWPELSCWVVPIVGSDRALGVIVVRLEDIGRAVGDEERRHLETMARQVGAALQRVRLARDARSAAMAAASESARTALLASISHDLRTPLAVILGCATTLAQQRDRLAAAERDALLATIVAETAQMSTAAENVLQLARLGSGALALRRDWESIEEIVGSVGARLRRRGLDGRLRARVQAGMPLVRADGVLLAQAIVNLVDNALAHSPPHAPVDIDAEVVDGQVRIAVRDRGPGIDETDAPHLFEMFYRGRTETARAGVGLGLAICQAVAQAHGGTIRAGNREGGGAEFTIALPLGEHAPPWAADAPAPPGDAA